MSDEVLQALVAASHRRGLKVFAHIGTIEDALACARAGVDVLAHGIYRGQVSKAQAEELARRRIPIVYTLAAFARTLELSRGLLVPTALDTATVPSEILKGVSGQSGRRFTGAPAITEWISALSDNERYWNDNVHTLYAAGVPLLIGTDSPLPAIFPGSSFHIELRTLAAAGVPPGELLLGATARAADALGLDGGRIEPGRPANLILVRGDPLADLSAAEQVELIVLQSRLVRRIPR
jgi:imidazolonepropionase-like amidohydrolase